LPFLFFFGFPLNKFWTMSTYIDKKREQISHGEQISMHMEQTTYSHKSWIYPIFIICATWVNFINRHQHGWPLWTIYIYNGPTRTKRSCGSPWTSSLRARGRWRSSRWWAFVAAILGVAAGACAVIPPAAFGRGTMNMLRAPA
jgi:hypothetical protein